MKFFWLTKSIVPIVYLGLAVSCSDSAVPQTSDAMTPIDTAQVIVPGLDSGTDTAKKRDSSVGPEDTSIPNGNDAFEVGKQSLDASPDTYTGSCAGSLGMMPECIARCAKLDLVACAASRECFIIKARRIEDNCFSPKEEAVGCHSEGCGAMLTRAVDLSGGTWFFTSTCIPEGWTEGVKNSGTILPTCESRDGSVDVEDAPNRTNSDVFEQDMQGDL